jgi:transcription antitermination factor NusG
MLANQWFVVQTNPQRETFVEQRLRPLEPYLPRFKNIKGRVEPLFRNYIFIPGIPEVSLITHTVGVRALLMAGEHPALISGKVIASWRDKERHGLVQLPPPPRFLAGQKLTILRGSLKYREVIHSAMVGKDRERVLIEMLGQSVSIVVPSADLAADFRPPPRNRLRRRPETVYGARTNRFCEVAV